MLGLAVLLAACAAPRTPDVVFRAAGVPIYSNAVLETARLTGTWVQVAAFANPGSPACAPGRVDITEALTVASDLCLDGRAYRQSGLMKPAGPGRFTLPDGQEWWVLWADTAYRTLAIGTPSGAFGFILNRDGDLPGDRLTAAREILDWNGYDTSRLRLLR